MNYDEIARQAVAYVLAQNRVRPRDDIGAANDVLRARIALTTCLIQAGWTPDDRIRTDMVRDLRVLGEPSGSFELTPELHQQTG